MAVVILTRMQQVVLDAIFAGHNITLLGKAGTGKTFLLKRPLETLIITKKVQVTSASGMATLLFTGAKTLHSFSGIGTCREGKEEILKRLKQLHVDHLRQWQELEVLIIDETSMISSRVLETVEFVMRSVRNSDRPFGGLQTIVSADFFQLPPVANEFDPGEYTFQYKHWDKIFPHKFLLTEIVRQDERDFIEFLGNLADGTCTERDVIFVKENLVKNLNPVDFDLEFIPKIVCTNFEIAIDTIEHLDELPGDPVTYSSIDEGKISLLKRCIADKKLSLKPGTPVMLLYNLNSELVNGKRGKVAQLREEDVIVEFPNTRYRVDRRSWAYYDDTNPQNVIAKRTQIPLKPCWVITAHKSQGQTLETAEVVSGNEFVQGQLYVACSRVKSKKGLCLKGFNLNKLIPPPAVVKDFYNTIEDKNLPLKADCSCCTCISMDEADTIHCLEQSQFDIDSEIQVLGATFDDETFVADLDYTEFDISDTDDIQECEEGSEMNLEIDFDLILESLTNESNIPWEFPDQFNLKDFLNMLKDSAEVDPDWDTDKRDSCKRKSNSS